MSLTVEQINEQINIVGDRQFLEEFSLPAHSAYLAVRAKILSQFANTAPTAQIQSIKISPSHNLYTAFGSYHIDIQPFLTPQNNPQGALLTITPPDNSARIELRDRFTQFLQHFSSLDFTGVGLFGILTLRNAWENAQEVNLSHNDIGNIFLGLSPLRPFFNNALASSLRKVKKVILANNRLVPDGPLNNTDKRQILNNIGSFITGLTGTSILDLRNNNLAALGEDGLRAITEAIEKTRSIEQVLLGNNGYEGNMDRAKLKSCVDFLYEKLASNARDNQYRKTEDKDSSIPTPFFSALKTKDQKILESTGLDFRIEPPSTLKSLAQRIMGI